MQETFTLPSIHVMEGMPDPETLKDRLNHYGFSQISFSPRLASEKGELPRIFVERFIKLLSPGFLGLSFTVACGRRLLGIPQDHLEAREMLKLISGRRHQVWVSMGFQTPKQKFIKTIMTRVSFKRLTTTEIDSYLLTEEWKEHAGAYTIFGAAASFIKSINGSPGALYGLPEFEFSCLLNKYKQFYGSK